MVDEAVVKPEDGVGWGGIHVRHDATNTVVALGVGSALVALLHVMVIGQAGAVVDIVVGAVGSGVSVVVTADAMGAVVVAGTDMSGGRGGVELLEDVC